MESGLIQRIDAGFQAVSRCVPFFRQSFGRVDSQWKEDASRVTETDHRISREILGELGGLFPNDDFCSEELPPEEGRIILRAPFAWVLDPVDGTNNFALGIPHCAISLALLHDGVPLYGWIYDFPGDRLVHGGAGRGLFAGRELLEPSPLETGVAVPLGIQFPLDDPFPGRLLPLLRKRRIRSLGSSTLEGLYVALRLFEGAVDFRVKPWDIAACFALFPEVGIEARFLGHPAFPLREFDPAMESTPYAAGSDMFLAEVADLLG